jgi:aryl-phospho-beta-D-glucosidase BglC (GH1 family)
LPEKLKISALLLAAVLLLTLAAGCSKGSKRNTDPASQDAGIRPLHVEGTELKDEDGNTVRLTGMSSHGLLWYPEYANAAAMRTLREYGANTFRVAVYSSDEGGGYVQRKDDSLKLACMAIENAIDEEMYVIVDWHILSDGNPLENQWFALDFFEQISSRYKDSPNIIYEICNEPNGHAGWDDIRAYAGEVIPAIRKNAPGAVVLVGTPEYSYSFDKVFEAPLDIENVMYTFHYYAGQHGSYYNQLFDRCEKEGLPVFVSEWGVNYGSNGKPALSQGEQFAKVLERRGISWTAWSLCNKDEVFSAIKPDCDKLSGWDESDLSDVGKIFFSAF